MIEDKTPHRQQLKFIDVYIDNEIVKSDCIKQFGRSAVEYMICAGHPTQRKSIAKVRITLIRELFKLSGSDLNETWLVQKSMSNNFENQIFS